MLRFGGRAAPSPRSVLPSGSQNLTPGVSDCQDPSETLVVLCLKPCSRMLFKDLGLKVGLGWGRREPHSRRRGGDSTSKGGEACEKSGVWMVGGWLKMEWVERVCAEHKGPLTLYCGT